MYTVDFQIDLNNSLFDLNVNVEFYDGGLLINSFAVTTVDSVELSEHAAEAFTGVFAKDIREELELDRSIEELLPLALEQAEDEQTEMRIA